MLYEVITSGIVDFGFMVVVVVTVIVVAAHAEDFGTELDAHFAAVV